MSTRTSSLVAGLTLAAAVLPVLAQTAAASAPATALIKPGLWEITVVHETPGTNVRRSVVSRSCFSAEDVASAQRLLPRQREAGMPCESRELKVVAQVATWQVACRAKDSSLIGPAKLSFASGGYLGQADLELKKATGKPVKVNQRISGKLIGDCK